MPRFPDEVLTNADWPKRTPDRLEDIEREIEEEKKKQAQALEGDL